MHECHTCFVCDVRDLRDISPGPPLGVTHLTNGTWLLFSVSLHRPNIHVTESTKYPGSLGCHYIYTVDSVLVFDQLQFFDTALLKYSLQRLL